MQSTVISNNPQIEVQRGHSGITSCNGSYVERGNKPPRNHTFVAVVVKSNGSREAFAGSSDYADAVYEAEKTAERVSSTEDD